MTATLSPVEQRDDEVLRHLAEHAETIGEGGIKRIADQYQHGSHAFYPAGHIACTAGPVSRQTYPSNKLRSCRVNSW